MAEGHAVHGIAGRLRQLVGARVRSSSPNGAFEAEVFDRRVIADAQAVVLWTAGVRSDIRVDTGGLKSMLRGGSGEMLQMAFTGEGYVLLRAGAITAEQIQAVLDTRTGNATSASSPTSSIARPPVDRSCFWLKTVGAALSWISVFHSAQSGHCPCQRE